MKRSNWSAAFDFHRQCWDGRIKPTVQQITLNKLIFDLIRINEEQNFFFVREIFRFEHQQTIDRSILVWSVFLND